MDAIWGVAGMFSLLVFPSLMEQLVKVFGMLEYTVKNALGVPYRKFAGPRE